MFCLNHVSKLATRNFFDSLSREAEQALSTGPSGLGLQSLSCAHRDLQVRGLSLIVFNIHAFGITAFAHVGQNYLCSLFTNGRYLVVSRSNAF